MKKACVALLAVLMSCVFIASSANRAADADCYGDIDTEKNADGVDGDIVFAEPNCVRPAVWITLSDNVKKAEK
jgi:hypothetical protein